MSGGAFLQAIAGRIARKNMCAWRLQCSRLLGGPVRIFLLVTTADIGRVGKGYNAHAPIWAIQ